MCAAGRGWGGGELETPSLDLCDLCLCMLCVSGCAH